MNLFADIPPHTFWNDPSNSSPLLLKVVITLLAVSLAFYLVRNVGPRGRRFIVGAFTFVAGGFYVLLYFWPQPIARHHDQVPNGIVERISFNIDDATPVMGDIANIFQGFLLGLGVASILRVHVGRVVKQQRDWGFSVILLIGIVLMATYGYWDWYVKSILDNGAYGVALGDQKNWTFVNYAYDFLFNGVFQEMVATMFSIIAFFILSAAFRAFRIRSIEATILLATALIVMLSLLSAFEYWWMLGVGGQKSTFTLTEIYQWIQNSLQTPAIRGIDFGMGIGALAMGLRLWLSLEKQGAN